MKKLFTLLTTSLLLFLSSCGDDDVCFNVYPNGDLHVGASGGEYTFDVEFKGYDESDHIYVTSTANWVNVTDAYDYYFSLSIEPNQTSMERSAIVIVSDDYSEFSPIKIMVYQSAGSASNDNGNHNGNNNGNGGNNDTNDTYISAPTNLTASVDDTIITLYWAHVSIPEYFNIYVGYERNGEYEYLGSVYGNETTVSLEAEDEGTYYFKITAESDGVESGYSNIAYATVTSSSSGDSSTTYPPSKPTNVRATQQGNTIVVSWNASSNATRYAVYYVRPYPYDIEQFEWTTQTNMTFNPRVDGSWTFWVVASNDEYENSDPSSKVTCYYQSSSSGGGGSSTTTQLDTPTNLDYWSDL